MFRQRSEAKHADQDPEGRSAGAEGSLKETPAPGKAPQVLVSGSKAAFPTETTHQGERTSETALGILGHIHAIRLKTIHNMGGVRELEQTIVRTLMAEFARLQLILGEDLTKSLSALCSEMETSMQALSSDLLSVLNLHSGDPTFLRMKELIQKHQQSVSMKVNLPLMELEAATEDLGGFLQRCLSELSSHSRSQEVIKELSQTISTQANEIREAIHVPGIQEPAVFQQVMLGLAAEQPLEAIFVPGILDGLSGRLGLTPPDVADPPTSARVGMSRRWAAALREAVMRTEGRDVDLEQVTPHVVHPGLHQDYDLDFQMRRVDDIAPTLTSPMLSGLTSSVPFLGRPEVPEEPVSHKMEEGLWGCSRTPTGPDAPGPSRISESAPLVCVAEVETEGNKLYKQEGIDLDQTLPGINPEDAAAVFISDDDKIDFSVDTPQGVSTPKVEPAWKQKQPLEDRSPRSSPPKKWATEEKEESPPPREAVLPLGVMEEDILPKRYEIFILDHDWVQDVRCSLLGLETETTPSRKDIDNSSHFIPQAASSKSELPEVITDHWLPILRREGLLVECPPDQFTALADWVPLYTPEGLQKYLPAALSSFPSKGTPSLTAVVPPGFRVGTDKEFLLCNFHHHQCLVRQSFNLDGRRRQLTFCPYCRVINENSDMALSHVRKHLDLQFICGGCYSKSFLNGPALNKHMRTQCPSVSAIRNRSKSSRR